MHPTTHEPIPNGSLDRCGAGVTVATHPVVLTHYAAPVSQPLRDGLVHLSTVAPDCGIDDAAIDALLARHDVRVTTAGIRARLVGFALMTPSGEGGWALDALTVAPSARPYGVIEALATSVGSPQVVFAPREDHPAWAPLLAARWCPFRTKDGRIGLAAPQHPGLLDIPRLDDV